MTTTTQSELALPQVPEQFQLYTGDADYDRVVNFPRVAAQCAIYAHENKLSTQLRWALFALLEQESCAVRDYFVDRASRDYVGCSHGVPEALGHNAGQWTTDMLAWSLTAMFGRMDIDRLLAFTHQLATLCDDHIVLLNREEQYIEKLRELPITHSEQGCKPMWSDDLRALLGDDFSSSGGQGGETASPMPKEVAAWRRASQWICSTTAAAYRIAIEQWWKAVLDKFSPH